MSARRMNQSQLLKEPQGTVQACVMHAGRSNWGDFFGKRFIKKKVPVSMVTEHAAVHLVWLITRVLSLWLPIS